MSEIVLVPEMRYVRGLLEHVLLYGMSAMTHGQFLKNSIWKNAPLAPGRFELSKGILK